MTMLNTNLKMKSNYNLHVTDSCTFKNTGLWNLNLLQNLYMNNVSLLRLYGLLWIVKSFRVKNHTFIQTFSFLYFYFDNLCFTPYYEISQWL